MVAEDDHGDVGVAGEVGSGVVRPDHVVDIERGGLGLAVHQGEPVVRDAEPLAVLGPVGPVQVLDRDLASSTSMKRKVSWTSNSWGPGESAPTVPSRRPSRYLPVDTERNV
nr:hypothetical protein GCM10025732_48740 [Glycomyces mayteni]